MKRIISLLLVISMLVSVSLLTTTAEDSTSRMLMRTSEIDHSWQEASAGKTFSMIGLYGSEGLDSAKPEKTPNATQASNHPSQDSHAVEGTLWLRNTNTWAFGYMIEVDGLGEGETVAATMKTNAWGHEHKGNTNGWDMDYDQTFTLTNGTYALMFNGRENQRVAAQLRLFLLFVKKFDLSFNKNVRFRVLAELEAVADGTDTTADFSSPAYITYHDRSGGIAKTDNVNTHGTFDQMSSNTPVIPAVALDYRLPDYEEDGVTYKQIGWCTDKNGFRPDVAYALGTMEVYPIFEAQGVPYVTFVSEDGTEEYDRRPIIPGKTPESSYVPVKASDDLYDYTFDYWADQTGGKVDLASLTEDATVYAHFAKSLQDHTVRFYSEDSRTLITTRKVKHGSALTDLPVSTKAEDAYQRYTFAKWVSLDGEDVSFDSVTGDMDVRASFTASFVNHFSDLEEGRWYTEAAREALVNGMMNGVSDTKFSPTAAASRAMFVTVLWRLEGAPDGNSQFQLPFTDVKAGSYYEDAVKWAYTAGVVSGVTDTSFAPNNSLTREQLATMLYRYAEQIRYYDMGDQSGANFIEFSDRSQIHDYAKQALLWMIAEENGYLQGVPSGDDLYLQPRVNANRAMMATILSRFRHTNEQALAEEFANPSSEFSPMPFWFWNDTLVEQDDTVDEYGVPKGIYDQMKAFKEKGVDGFVIHPRMGLDSSIEYMGETWLHYVRYAVELAAEWDMKVVLYDEAMYPSGSAHGMVVNGSGSLGVEANPEYASRGLEMRESPTLGKDEILLGQTERDGKTYYFVETYTNGHIRGVYYGEDDNQAGAPPSADLLNPDAVDKFIALTHEKYYEALSEYFGNTVIAIFTDEPSISGRFCKAGQMAWTGGLEQDGLLAELKANGVTEDELYYLFYPNSARGAQVKAIYDNIIYNRLNNVYYGKLANWCDAHKIALTGHPGSSMDIGLLDNFDIPCQDIVWNYIDPAAANGVSNDDSTMGKCASDHARHTGKRRNGNECFGACGSSMQDFTYDKMKWYLDWLFVRGCNFVIPHAFYYSVRGDRGNERPPEVGMRSLFWDDYKTISDYIKRCSAMNTDSVNITDVAILCTKDQLSWQAARPLFENQIEFNYLECDLLNPADIDHGAYKIGKQSYRVIITDRASYDTETDAFLKAFTKAGGTVIRYSGGAAYVNNVRSASMTDVDVDVNNMLRVTHVRKYGKDVLYFVNEGEQTITTTLHQKVAEVWDAKTGKMLENFSGDEYPLTLERRQSIYLILK